MLKIYESIGISLLLGGRARAAPPKSIAGAPFNLLSISSTATAYSVSVLDRILNPDRWYINLTVTDT